MADYDNTAPVAIVLPSITRPIYVAAAAESGNPPGLGTTVDGVATTVAGTLVLVKDATDAKENGVWSYVSVGVFERATGYTAEGSIKKGMQFGALAGTANAGKVFTVATDDPITPGTTDLTFTEEDFAGSAEPIALT